MKLNLTGDYKLIDSNGNEVFNVKNSILEIKIKEIDIQYKKCEYCGKKFAVSHGSQRFCPPLPDKKRSSCEMAYNNRKKKQDTLL